MKKRNAAITAKMKEIYGINVSRNYVHINSPAFININRDEEYNVERSKHTLRISNRKVCVALWLEVKNMHVTVYE